MALALLAPSRSSRLPRKACSTRCSAAIIIDQLRAAAARASAHTPIRSVSATNATQRRATPAASGQGGPSSGYCVRTCDGKYFPVKSSGNMTATELCKSFCPAASTKVFAGSKIDYSVAPDGTRYADLDNAFLFRERTVDNCTCNGKTAGGLAPLKPELDPTLRPGDIVATNEGLVTFNGNRKAKSAEFTPIDKSGGSSEWKLRLMSIKVAPAPPRAEEPVKPVEEEKKAERTDRRRAQR